MKTIIIFISFFIFLTAKLLAQKAHFITEGEIMFEKTLNMHAVLKKGIESTNANRIAAYEQYKKTQPQFLILKSKLAFIKTNTSYIPEPSTFGAGLSYFDYNPIYTQINKVYSSLINDSSVVQKDVLNQRFLIKDKKPTIKWKITDETREIAGYTCRRANGLVNDSVYVVAFYTNKIPLSGGPESFHGLPGMILGLAIPYENVTWFATQVTEKKDATSLYLPPNRVKTTTRKELKETLEKTLKLNGNFSESLLLGYLL